jgi:hypothetical protein
MAPIHSMIMIKSRGQHRSKIVESNRLNAFGGFVAGVSRL